MDASKVLAGIYNELNDLSDQLESGGQKMYAGKLREQAEILSKARFQATMTIEALNPAFDQEGGYSGYLKFADIAYNAFMIGRNMENREEGGRCDWFNDTWPLVQAGLEKIQAECIKRLEENKQYF